MIVINYLLVGFIYIFFPSDSLLIDHGACVDTDGLVPAPALLLGLTQLDHPQHTKCKRSKHALELLTIMGSAANESLRRLNIFDRLCLRNRIQKISPDMIFSGFLILVC